jgi:hypothetical protein
MLTEDRLGTDGHVAGIVPVDNVITQLGFRHFQVPGQGALDLVIARRRADIQVALRNIQAAALETNVDDSACQRRSIPPPSLPASDTKQTRTSSKSDFLLRLSE